MSKSNKTIGAWLSDVDVVEDYEDDTRSLWSGTGVDEYNDRRTVVGGWERGSVCSGSIVDSFAVGNSQTRAATIFVADMVPRSTRAFYDRSAYRTEVIDSRVGKYKVLAGTVVVARGQRCSVVRNYGLLVCEDGSHVSVDENHSHIWFNGTEPIVRENNGYMQRLRNGVVEFCCMTHEAPRVYMPTVNGCFQSN